MIFIIKAAPPQLLYKSTRNRIDRKVIVSSRVIKKMPPRRRNPYTLTYLRGLEQRLESSLDPIPHAEIMRILQHGSDTQVRILRNAIRQRRNARRNASIRMDLQRVGESIARRINQ